MESENVPRYNNMNHYSNNSSLSHGYSYQVPNFFDNDSTEADISSDEDSSYIYDSLSHEKHALDPFFWINRWSEAQQEMEPSPDVAPQDLVFQRLQKMAIVATDFVHVAEHYGKYARGARDIGVFGLRLGLSFRSFTWTTNSSLSPRPRHLVALQAARSTTSMGLLYCPSLLLFLFLFSSSSSFSSTCVLLHLIPSYINWIVQVLRGCYVKCGTLDVRRRGERRRESMLLC
jgi:hypothetical protein